MKIGIITDIHNNKTALEAVLNKFEIEKCDGIICSGDILGIGAYPDETVKMIMDIKNLISCVSGNHENYFNDGLPHTFPNEQNMGLAEMEYHKWEHKRLSEQSRTFIKGLECKNIIEVEGKVIYVAHYSLDENNNIKYYFPSPSTKELQKMFANVEADIIVYGHNHDESVIFDDRIYINCGSLGCPADEKNIARAGILEIDEEISYKSIKVQYDVSGTIEDIRRFKFPAMDEILKFFYGQD
jgi:putative phosphoesterase